MDRSRLPNHPGPRGLLVLAVIALFGTAVWLVGSGERRERGSETTVSIPTTRAAVSTMPPTSATTTVAEPLYSPWATLVPTPTPPWDGTSVSQLVVSSTIETIDVDAGQVRLPVGERTELPNNAWLDFLAGLCEFDTCYRDAHLIDPLDDQRGSGTWVAGHPFHIRHGFVNETADPLDDGYDLVVYVTRRQGLNLGGGVYDLDQTHRFTTDYVMRGLTAKCGPGYWNQTEVHTCEWFVHDFPQGLPPGRYDIWVEWYAPCSAWLDLGLTRSCNDPSEVSSRFASEVNMLFSGEAFGNPFDLAVDPLSDTEPITRGAAD